MNEMTIPKPIGSTWTDEQWQAISSTGSNLLIAAAAGSGKTAVLVERIIRKISANVNVDQLLVATFTNAAAAEMKERIRVALEKQYLAHPDSDHLRRQLALMGKASITTLHSFCIQVIRQYYTLIDLDPGFRIANTTEIQLLRMDVLDEVFEEQYANADFESDVLDYATFAGLVQLFGDERGDDPLYQLVLKLYDFSRSNPWPEQWLAQLSEGYRLVSDRDVATSTWMEPLQFQIQLQLNECIRQLQDAIHLAKEPDGPHHYVEMLESDMQYILYAHEMVATLDFERWQQAISTIKFMTLSRKKVEHVNVELRERVKKMRDDMKSNVDKLKKKFFQRSLEQFAEEIRIVAPAIRTLLTVVSEFGRRFADEKRRRGLVDFSDLEHYCLQILRDPTSTPEEVIPSIAAQHYQNQFEEILLDEYQDTNMVQESIVRLISRTNPGNLFMVGDVKQSIYRFRLAEPNLFLSKYNDYLSGKNGIRIDLAKNFRSRHKVIQAVNEVFQGMMRKNIAEIDYDERAELKLGANYPKEDDEQYKVTFTLLNRDGADNSIAETSDAEDELVSDESDLTDIKQESIYMAQQMIKLKESGFTVYDAKAGGHRLFCWRDVVILLRAEKNNAEQVIEQLQKHGIPAYAELGTGYFDATEVLTMISLLRIIDNPYQDIPLVSVLRSPVVALSTDELAIIRLSGGKYSFYEALQMTLSDTSVDLVLRNKLTSFVDQLTRWREQAKSGSLADLVWQLYRETGYYDLVGGLVGGVQRQANLRALYDRVRQYEATSFRGLFRFLRFIDRMRDSGGDLGVASALGEQEDVVRIMTIHKSKGLEFPVVFVPGLGKKFNFMDLKSPYLIHKQFGIGHKFVDPVLNMSYPTLPYLAIGQKIKNEMLAEEMRVLYVAMTRAKEKLYLIGSLKEATKHYEKWLEQQVNRPICSDAQMLKALRFSDWIGPHIVAASDVCQFNIESTTSLVEPQAATVETSTAHTERQRQDRLEALRQLAVMETSGAHTTTIGERLDWNYAHTDVTLLAAKTSVTEMKRQQLQDDEWTAPLVHTATLALKRPKFIEEVKLTAAERGTVNHLIMQHIPLQAPVTRQVVQQTIDSLVNRNMLTMTQAKAIWIPAVVAFYESEVGQKLLQATLVRRELPFSMTLPAKDVYRDTSVDEPVLIQGVIDCLFEDEQGLFIVDYKTDRIMDDQWEAAAEKHRFQMNLYRRAIEHIINRKISGVYLFFFDGARVVQL